MVTLFSGLIPLSDFGVNADVYFQNKPFRVQCEVAQTPDQQQRGLMFRQKLDDFKGMVFVYDAASTLTFWMKNTYIPLYIIYFGSDFSVNSFFFMKPLNEKIIYHSKKPSRFALEVSPSTFDKLMLSEGDRGIFEFRMYYNLLGRSVSSSIFSFKEQDHSGQKK